jgi:hypothetical protein
LALGVRLQQYPPLPCFLRKVFQTETLRVDFKVSAGTKTKARLRPGQAFFLKFSISSASRGISSGVVA